ncbi:fungal specific transcription factor [Colletotrichum musicola]|uniref:Fungal specific transcription factor n=1 Tax=Colletotrichum musicola TaxID=2175873 RepID=A0A8H6IVT6_9PEZI|nr:fungal specific transcription factor [Colletotrichum musicola]
MSESVPLPEQSDEPPILSESEKKPPRRKKLPQKPQRRRKPICCVRCRWKKVRCDRKQPCSTCQTRDHPDLCRYDSCIRSTPPKSTSSTQQEIKKSSHRTPLPTSPRKASGSAIPGTNADQQTPPPEIPQDALDSTLPGTNADQQTDSYPSSKSQASSSKANATQKTDSDPRSRPQASSSNTDDSTEANGDQEMDSNPSPSLQASSSNTDDSDREMDFDPSPTPQASSSNTHDSDEEMDSDPSPTLQASSHSTQPYIRLRSSTEHARRSWDFIHNDLASVLLLILMEETRYLPEARNLQDEMIASLFDGDNREDPSDHHGGPSHILESLKKRNNSGPSASHQASSSSTVHASVDGHVDNQVSTITEQKSFWDNYSAKMTILADIDLSTPGAFDYIMSNASGDSVPSLLGPF